MRYSAPAWDSTNAAFCPPAVTKVVGVDPSAASSSLTRKRIAASPVPVEMIDVSAERLPVPDASFTSIVSTFSLCTIDDVEHALIEIRRVLTPQGRFHFVEHGRADDPAVQRWQDRLNPLQQTLFGGCRLNRPIAALIEQAGFDLEWLDTGYLKGAPKSGGFLYRGIAKRAGS